MLVHDLIIDRVATHGGRPALTRADTTLTYEELGGAVCDGGLHHHLAASGNFGQVIRKNYPVAAVRRTRSREEISVVGPLCTPLDLLGDRMTLDRLDVDSLVAVLQSGAYGASASLAAFLAHPPCTEIVV